MITKIRIKNFKKFEEVEIELGKPVVFIGPNNSGKTTALQALALWEAGTKKWWEKREGKSSPERRPGVTINRNDLLLIPIPTAKLLWHNLHIRNVTRNEEGKQETQNIKIEIVVEGFSNDKNWRCGFEFDYANEESIYCRPIQLDTDSRMVVPEESKNIRLAFLPPMSGLAAIEPKWEEGRINVLLGEGQTAQVLRNLCYKISKDYPENWQKLAQDIRTKFNIEIQPPKHIDVRGELTMTYKERSIELDISAAGRGLHQTLLLMAYLYSKPNTILLLDEPDAHLEIIRQRQIYQHITDIARKQNSQIIIASHSEVVLNEAADRDLVIAFIGNPHRIDRRASQLLKSLKDISIDQYYLAEEKGWVLYLEGSTDLAILQTLAKKLNHPAVTYLEDPFVYYVANQPRRACEHYFGLLEAKKDLKGLAIYDRISPFPDNPSLVQLMWQKRELENYLCNREVLLNFARKGFSDDLFGREEMNNREKIMLESITEIEKSLTTLGKPAPWSDDIKASDDFFGPLFRIYSQKLGAYNEMEKNTYYKLAELLPESDIPHEINEKLNEIVRVAKLSNPGKIENRH